MSDSDDVTSLARSIPNREFEKNTYPPPPLFCDVYANKGLKGALSRKCVQISGLLEIDFVGQTSPGPGLLLPLCSAFRVSLLQCPSNLFSAPLRLCVEVFSCLFPHTKNCTIMHFSRKSALNMHYNALFGLAPPPAPLNSRLSILNSRLKLISFPKSNPRFSWLFSNYLTRANFIRIMHRTQRPHAEFQQKSRE